MPGAVLWGIVTACELAGICYIVIGIRRRSYDRIPFSFRTVRRPRHFEESSGVQLIFEGASSVIAGLMALAWMIFVQK